MRARALLLGLFALALAPSPSHADTCLSHTYGQAPFLCAYAHSSASPGGTEATVNGLEYFNLIGGPADAVSAGDGGLAGSASIDVDWGLVSGACSADNGEFTTFDLFAEARDIARAEGAYGDIAALASDTLPPGTPVTLSVRVEAVEGDAGDGGVHMEYSVANNANQTATLLQRQIELNFGNHTLPAPIPLDGYRIGDSLIFAFFVRINASTTNNVNPPRISSAAQLDAARLVFDVDTPGVTLISPTSGEDYATVPEASQVLLLAAGALALLAVRRFRGVRA